jgi:hypothetical protein
MALTKRFRTLSLPGVLIVFQAAFDPLEGLDLNGHFIPVGAHREKTDKTARSHVFR